MNPDTYLADEILDYVDRLEVQGVRTSRAIQLAAERFGAFYNDIADLVYNLDDGDDGETYENRDFDHEAAMDADFF